MGQVDQLFNIKSVRKVICQYRRIYVFGFSDNTLGPRIIQEDIVDQA